MKRTDKDSSREREREREREIKMVDEEGFQLFPMCSERERVFYSFHTAYLCERRCLKVLREMGLQRTD